MKSIKVKEILLLAFAVICNIFYIILYIMLPHRYICICENDAGEFLLYILIACQIVAAMLTENKVTLILLMILVVFDFLMGHVYFTIVAILLLLLINRKKYKKNIIRITAIICIVLWVLYIGIMWVISSYFVTSSNYKMYESPYDNGYVIVLEDYSFNDKVLSIIHYGNYPKQEFLGYTFAKADLFLTKVYNKIENVNDLEIAWIDESTVTINGRSYQLPKS